MAFALWLLLISPFVGSFAGVLADRLPEHRNVLTARSRCNTCNAALRPRDMIPLVSRLVLHGRCRHCGAGIPRHLFWAEVLGVLAACAAVYGAVNPVQMGLAAAWMWILLALGLADATTWRLPDALTIALFIAGAGLGLSSPGAGVVQVAGSAFAATGAFWLLRVVYFRLRGREGLGAGDVKLMAGIGAALPLAALPMVTLVAAAAALGVATIKPGILDSGNGSSAMPFGAFLAGAAAIVWVGLNLP